MRFRSICLVTAAVTVAVSIPAVAAAQPSSRPVTYTRDVAPIIATRCSGCHRPGGDGPFSLTSFDEVRRRGSMIVAATRSRYMPPWKPAPGFGEFSGERRLRDIEIATLA